MSDARKNTRNVFSRNRDQTDRQKLADRGPDAHADEQSASRRRRKPP